MRARPRLDAAGRPLDIDITDKGVVTPDGYVVNNVNSVNAPYETRDPRRFICSRPRRFPPSAIV